MVTTYKPRQTPPSAPKTDYLPTPDRTAGKPRKHGKLRHKPPGSEYPMPICSVCGKQTPRATFGEWEQKDGWHTGRICPRCFNDDTKKEI